MRKIISTIRNNPILCISGLLALISCFFVLPDLQYLSYINVRVLAILFGLMLIVAALGHIGTFDVLTNKLLSNVKTYRGISLLMSLLSFFLSMFLTNDVSLVTLVPFAIMVLAPFGENRRLMFTLIIMTVAANLGSMLTPIGNPQNLYLYDNYKIALPEFLLLMIPYSALSLAMIVALTFILVKGSDKLPPLKNTEVKKLSFVKLLIYFALFVLNILTVVGYVHFLISLGVTVAAMLIMDRNSFKKADYNLLATFVFFFILIGNIGRIDAITGALSGLVSSYPVPAAILSSQIISNVPAAMLLSAFTDDGKSLIIGTNLGGLGTLIASMASLITYRFHAKFSKELKEKTGGKQDNYILNFTIINIVMLVILFGFYLILNR
ncbi:MAG: citrate transporter [Ruminococcaceae bacterium]|nr:citrate transporter [Oscillospiraceae bacterium]